jgi:hypothetical protein
MFFLDFFENEMLKQFTSEDIESINNILNSKAHEFENTWTWKLFNQAANQSIVFTIYNCVPMPDEKLNIIISVQTNHGYFELHHCTHYLLFEPDEVIFIEANESKISSLVIGKECSCSMYSNINRELLRVDITELPAPLLLSVMQMSLAESFLD